LRGSIYLQLDHCVVEDDFLGQEVSADRCFVLVGELLLDVPKIIFLAYWFSREVLPTL
jgi:hypothetical protein